MASSTDEPVCIPSHILLMYLTHAVIQSELKELIAMHSHGASHGGDLKNDTVTIVGATLDLQEKVVEQVPLFLSKLSMARRTNHVRRQ